jgi:hypothetical protein
MIRWVDPGSTAVVMQSQAGQQPNFTVILTAQ